MSINNDFHIKKKKVIINIRVSKNKMAIVRVEELISRGIVIREYKKIGVCSRSVIKFVGENKYYNYQNGRPLSKILSNKISNPLYNTPFITVNSWFLLLFTVVNEFHNKNIKYYI